MRRPRILEDRLPDDATTRATLWGGICMCVLGMAVNDSGIAVPAVMFTLFLPFVMHQVLTDPIAPPSADDDAAEPRQEGEGPDARPVGATAPSGAEASVGAGETGGEP
jgi:hypothetical protein